MGLPNLQINLQNGALGRVAATDDGVAGLILTGAPVADKFNLNTVYPLSSARGLTPLGITEENNPLIHKEVAQFYTQAGDGAELYLIAVSAATTLEDMTRSADPDAAIHKLMAATNGRIRLLGFNTIPPADYEAGEDEPLDPDVVNAVEQLQSAGKTYESKIAPFRAFLPGCLWDGTLAGIFMPREASNNRAAIVLASDGLLGDSYSAAVGQVLGRAAAVPVHYPISRVKSGAVTYTGWLTNGETPEEAEPLLDALHEAGFIIYRKFVGRNGYYYNDDPTCAPVTDDYGNLYLGRIIDKAIILAYNAFIDEIQDTIEVDDAGQIPTAVAVDYQSTLSRAIGAGMNGEISNVEAFVDPAQDILTTSKMEASLKIRPRGVLRDISINLGFENPAVKQ